MITPGLAWALEPYNEFCEVIHKKSLDAPPTGKQADEEHYKKDDKEDFGETRRHTGHSEETKRPCDQGDYQEDQRVM